MTSGVGLSLISSTSLKFCACAKTRQIFSSRGIRTLLFAGNLKLEIRRAAGPPFLHSVVWWLPHHFAVFGGPAPSGVQGRSRNPNLASVRIGGAAKKKTKLLEAVMPPLVHSRLRALLHFHEH